MSVIATLYSTSGTRCQSFPKVGVDIQNERNIAITVTFCSYEVIYSSILYDIHCPPTGDVTGDTNLYMTGTSELVFGNVKSADAGYYQCKAIESKEYLMLSGVGHLQVI